jgi:endonuclease-3
VNKITGRLFWKYRTLADYARTSPAKFSEDIRGVNYYKTKAKAIIKDVQIVKKRFGGRVPRTMEEMLELRGVARKTANIVLSSGFGIIEGIAVDTHVRRLTQLLGLTIYADPKKIENDLMRIIPKGKEWKEFPLRLVEYGRKYCPARPHEHKNCPLRKYYLSI